MGLLAAWLVHLYTASSAVFGLWAIVAAFQSDFRLAIYLMLLTLWIDSSDGTLARLADVRGRIPWFDGRRLDDIVDYFTYVLVPAIFLIQADLVPHPAWVAAPVLASAYGFSRTDAKTEDDFFLGFPSYWNVLAIYLHLLGIEAYAGLWIVLGLAAAVFVPLRYIYPSRTRSLRPITLAVLLTWGLSIVWVAAPVAPDPVWVWATLFGPAYYFGASLLLNLGRTRRG